VANSREEILEQVKSALSEKLGIDESEITEEASFEEDLGADSLDLVEVVMDLEDQFGLKIPDEDARGLTTVGKAIDYVIAPQGLGSPGRARDARGVGPLIQPGAGRRGSGSSLVRRSNCAPLQLFLTTSQP